MIKKLGKKLKDIFAKSDNEDFFNEIEDLLIESDLGGSLSIEIISKLKSELKNKGLKNLDDIKNILYIILDSYIITEELKINDDDLNLFLFLGVNGVGKTTSIGRVANHFKKLGINEIVLSAGDTFRAAAIDQLKIHGERNGLRVVAQSHGADPGAVIFDTIKSAISRNEKLILADTAGRMHNKVNLVRELEKINKIILNEIKPDNYKKILVIDSTTGQNGISQGLEFNSAVKIDGVILTKYDSTAKGGIVPALCNKLGVPFYFLGVGEGLNDLKVFNKDEYIRDLLDM